MSAFLVLLVCLALLVAGLVFFFRSVRAKTSKAPGCGMMLAAPVLLLIAGSMWPASPSTRATTPKPEPVTEQPAPTPTPTPTPAPEPEPTPEPAARADVGTDGSTPGEMLNVIEGRERSDPDIPAALAALDDVCPENGMFVADMVVNFKELAYKNTGQSMTIPEVIDAMYRAQEGPAQQAGMSCVETSAAVLTIMENGQ